ncbi:MAG: diacylglycerol kinase family protein [ANME-2 cluster archaeon]|nr:diacylglycerol kinase family protein [ANME-2 cluster archaeon]
MSVAFDENTVDGSPAGYFLLYNKRSASYKKAMKKWDHRFANLFRLPIENISEDWLMEQSPEGLIVLGGDATVHSVENAILNSGLDIPIGIIPGGEGNDFYLKLINRDETDGPEGLTHNDVFEVECPDSTSKKYAVNTLEWGIGAMVAARRENNEGRLLIGMVKYFYLVMKSLFTFNPLKATIRLNGKDLEFDDLSAVVVGFGSSTLGGGYRLFPD